MSVNKEVQDIKNKIVLNSLSSKVGETIRSRVFSFVANIVLVFIIAFVGSLVNSGADFHEVINNINIGNVGFLTLITIIVKILVNNLSISNGIYDAEKRNGEIGKLRVEISKRYTKLNVKETGKVLNDYNNEIIEQIQKEMRESEIYKLELKASVYDENDNKYIKIYKKVDKIKQKTYKIKYKKVVLTDLSAGIVNKSGVVDKASLNFSTKKTQHAKNGIGSIASSILSALMLGSISIGALLTGGSILDAVIYTVVMSLFLLISYINVYNSTYNTHNSVYLESLNHKKHLIELCENTNPIEIVA